MWLEKQIEPMLSKPEAQPFSAHASSKQDIVKMPIDMVYCKL